MLEGGYPVSHPILDPFGAGAGGAMSRTEHVAIGLRAVPDDAASALRADRRKGMNGAFEAVEKVAFAADNDLERLVILVSAGFAGRHKSTN